MNKEEVKLEFIKFDEEKQERLIKIMSNNPLVDFENAVLLTIQNLENQFKELNDGNLNDYIKSNKIHYFNGKECYDFIKTDNQKLSNKLHFTDFTKKWENETHIEIYVNSEVDDNKKNVFYNDNKLWISDMITDEAKAYYILKSYTDKVIENENSLGIYSLVYLLINNFYKEQLSKFNNSFQIKIPKVILYSEDEVRYNLYYKAFDYYYKIIQVFIDKFLKLNDLIDIMNNNYTKNELTEDILKNVIRDINENNINDFPYYFIKRQV